MPILDPQIAGSLEAGATAHVLVLDRQGLVQGPVHHEVQGQDLLTASGQGRVRVVDRERLIAADLVPNTAGNRGLHKATDPALLKALGPAPDLRVAVVTKNRVPIHRTSRLTTNVLTQRARVGVAAGAEVAAIGVGVAEVAVTGAVAIEVVAVPPGPVRRLGHHHQTVVAVEAEVVLVRAVT